MLFISNGVSATFDGVISGSGALIKSGSGSLMLNGVNLYTGNTTISSGTLGGNGTVSGSISVNSTIAPGTNGVGNLSTGSNNWNSGGIYLCEINGTNATASDQMIISGALNVQATAGSPFTIKNSSWTRHRSATISAAASSV